MNNRRRRAVAPLLGVAAIVTVVIVYLLLMGQPKSVDLPADDASPEAVVEAYVRALDAGDCDTAQALTAPPNRESAVNWCKNISHLTDAKVAPHIVEESAWSGHGDSDEVVNVPVTFDLGLRSLRSDISMPEGHTDWGYRLVRSSPTEPWRIFSEGRG